LAAWLTLWAMLHTFGDKKSAWSLFLHPIETPTRDQWHAMTHRLWHMNIKVGQLLTFLLYSLLHSALLCISK
jgi:hypothetical protein